MLWSSRRLHGIELFLEKKISGKFELLFFDCSATILFLEYVLREGFPIMRKLFLSILFFSSLCTITAAQIAPETIELEEEFTITIEGQDSFSVWIKPSVFCQCALVKASVAMFPESREIALQEGFVKRYFESFIEHLKKERPERLDYLMGVGCNRISDLINTMGVLGVDEKEREYTIEFILKNYTVAQLEALVENELFQKSAILILAVIRKMQFEALFCNYGNHRKRCLDHPLNLGKRKVALLTSKNLWNLELSCANLYHEKLTERLLTPKMIEGKLTLKLDHYGLTSLVGLDTIPGLQTVERLELTGNEITVLTPALFAAMPQLQDLLIGDNHISRIDSESFACLPHLKKLILAGNRLTELTTLNLIHLPQLEEFYCGFNKLTVVDCAPFAGLVHLKKLYLNDNEIREINVSPIVHLPQLQELCLRENPMQQSKLREIGQMLPHAEVS